MSLFELASGRYKHQSTIAAGQIALGFVVPFAVQVGMGATAEAGAMRAGLQGLVSGVATAGGLIGRMYSDSTEILNLYDLLQPIGVAAVYAGANDLMNLSKSQGGVKDFTFSVVSGYAALGLKGFTEKAVVMFMESKAQTAEEKIQL